MNKQEKLNGIYKTIKELYGDCTFVRIDVNCEGMNLQISENPFTKGYCAKNINGETMPYELDV